VKTGAFAAGGFFTSNVLDFGLQEAAKARSHSEKILSVFSRIRVE